VVLLVEAGPGCLPARLRSERVQPACGGRRTGALAQEPRDQGEFGLREPCEVSATEFVVKVAQVLQPLADVLGQAGPYLA